MPQRVELPSLMRLVDDDKRRLVLWIKQAILRLFRLRHDNLRRVADTVNRMRGICFQRLVYRFNNEHATQGN